MEQQVAQSVEQLKGYAAALEKKNALLEKEVAERKQTEHALQVQREAMVALSAPVIKVWDGVLALPVIGMVDQIRALPASIDTHGSWETTKSASANTMLIRLRSFCKDQELPLSALSPERCRGYYEALAMRVSERIGKPPAVGSHRKILAEARTFLT